MPNESSVRLLTICNNAAARFARSGSHVSEIAHCKLRIVREVQNLMRAEENIFVS